MASISIPLSDHQRSRFVQFSRVQAGDTTPSRAAAVLGITPRQFRRAYAVWRKKGDASIIHGLCGQPSNNPGDVELKAQALAAYREHYQGYGPQLASEYLAKRGLPVPASTLRRWLITAGEWEVGVHIKPPQHRSRREPREAFGMMVQMDGSHHDWFNGRNPALPMLNLMVMVDDATGLTHARFSKEEDTHVAFSAVRDWCLAHGVPESMYVDRAAIYVFSGDLSAEDEIAGKIPETQFARAMRELHVKIICAHSPQAKGRVERKNGVLQDRLVKALEQAGISDIESANRFLKEEFLPEFNQKFAKPAAIPKDAHRPLADALPIDKTLEDVLAFEEERTVGQDWCVQWNNRVWQIDIQHQPLHLATRKVVVRLRLDGSIVLARHKIILVAREITQQERRRPEPTLAERVAQHAPQTKPKADHPWRREGVGKASKRAG